MVLRLHEIAVLKALGVELCDFCVRDYPVVKFPQKRPFAMLWPDGRADVFMDPWAACETCAPLVERKRLHLLLDRIIQLSPLFSQLSRREKEESRRVVKKMCRAMYEAGVERPEPLEPR